MRWTPAEEIEQIGPRFAESHRGFWTAHKKGDTITILFGSLTDESGRDEFEFAGQIQVGDLPAFIAATLRNARGHGQGEIPENIWQISKWVGADDDLVTLLRRMKAILKIKA